MTISTTATSVQYVRNGTTTQFGYPNKIFAAADLVVSDLDTSSPPIVNTLILGTDYTISNVDVDTGCLVNTTIPGIAGHKLDIRSSIAQNQLTSIKNQGSYLPELHEEFFDRITRELQDLTRKAYTFSISGPDNESVPWSRLPPAATRANTGLVFDGSGNPAVGVVPTVTFTQAIWDAYLAATVNLYPRTVAEIAAAVTPTTYAYPEGDIRRYGALTASANNAPAINSACAVSDAGGNAVFIPGGTWAITSTVNAIGSCSMYGVGNASIIAPATNSVDGITLGAADFGFGSRFFRDFQILGPSATTSTANGFNVAGINTALGGRNTGIQFSNLAIENFQVGVLCRQLWQSTFTNCFLYNVARGYYFHGQNIVNNINGGFVQRGAITAVGTDYGVFVDIASGTETTQSLHLTGVGVYGFSYNVSMQAVLFSTIEECDLSVYTVNGVQIITCQGGVAIRDTWIQAAPSAANPIAVNIVDVGTPIADKHVIDGCTLVGNTTTLQAGAFGVYIGAGINAGSVTNNTIGTAAGPFAQAVKNGAGANTVVTGNSIYSDGPTGSYDVFLNSSALNCTIGPNVQQNAAAVPLGFSGVTPPGLRFNGSGTFTGTLTGMTAGTTGTITWVATGGLVYLTPPNAGIIGTSNATTMTMTGLPTYLIPNANRQALARTIDSGTTGLGNVNVPTTGTLAFFKDVNNAAFTNTGSKGLNPTSLIYALG